MKRLAVFPQGALLRSPDGLSAMGPFLDQVQALLPYFEGVTVCARVTEKGAAMARFPEARMGVRALPPYAGRADFLAHVPHYRREILAAAREADVSLVVLPGYLGALASAVLQRARLPLFHWVVGDWGRVVVSRRSGAGRWLAHGLRPVVDGAMARLTRDTLSFFGGDLPRRASSSHCVRTSSTVWERDLRVCPEPAHGPLAPLQLLFLGRLSREKGAAVLVDALTILRGDGLDVRLDVAGTGPERDALHRQVATRGLEPLVRFHGLVPRGAPLERRFDQAHILVLPSLEDLQPRVLLEAMARGVPVVASDVGNVSSLVGHERNGILVRPGDAQALAAAVARLAADAGLRARLARAGEAVAADHTLEAESARMMAVVRAHFAGGG